MKKSYIIAALALTSCMVVGTAAASQSNSVTATFRPDVTLKVNGTKMCIRDSPGAAPPLPDDQVPKGIRRHLVGVGPGQAGDGLPHRALVPGGPMGGVEGLNQFKQFHVTTP